MTDYEARALLTGDIIVVNSPHLHSVGVDDRPDGVPRQVGRIRCPSLATVVAVGCCHVVDGSVMVLLVGGGLVGWVHSYYCNVPGDTRQGTVTAC
jgi:hypothetical protein